MKKALMLRLMAVIAIVIAVCFASSVLLLTGNERSGKEQEMRTELNLIRDIYNNSENHDYALAERISEMINGARLTFIDPEGTVFVDTYIEGEPADNHSTREEIANAIKYGMGVSIRYSNNLGRNQIYAAAKVENGDIIRISYSVNNFWDFAGMLWLPLIFTALLGLIAGLIAVKSSVKQIMKPINEVSSAMQLMKDKDYIPNKDEEIPPHKYEELDGFISVFNYMRHSISENIQTLESEREKESFILKNLSDGVILFNNDLIVISINNAAKKLLESNYECENESIPELIRQPAVIDAAQKVIAGNKKTSVEIVVGGKVLLVIMHPVAGSETTEGGGLMVIRDITEKRMSEQLRQDFFANAGHELKTPLTAISGFAELLENGLIPQDKKDYYIGRILTEANRMSTIISDILEISALESKNLPEEVSECSVMEVCNEVSESVEPAANQRNVTVSVKGDDFHVMATHKHIYELIENLVTNAIKYNKEGGSVEVELCDVGEIGCIYVRDTGIGIPKEYRQRVFERFFRVDKGRSTKEGSTGLGLSIVKHIVNCYGGTVTLDSVLGKGTVICVRLPSKHFDKTEIH